MTPVNQCIAASSLRRAVAYCSIPDAAHSSAYDSDAEASECIPGKVVADANSEAGEVQVKHLQLHLDFAWTVNVEKPVFISRCCRPNAACTALQNLWRGLGLEHAGVSRV